MPDRPESDLEDVFRDFRDEVSRDTEATETERQFKLGLTYKDMGMAEDAIRELGWAARSPQRRFEAASLVATTLLASDPVDRRVREFARLVEREHIAALYEELPPLYILVRQEEPEALALLRSEERHLLSLINGTWDVSTLVLASQGRELDTLKALAKLARMGLLGVLPGPQGSWTGKPHV